MSTESTPNNEQPQSSAPTSSDFPADTASAAFAPHSHPNDQYRKVKMKYFMSLGMSKPPRSASDPNDPSKKERTRTMPAPNAMPSSASKAEEDWDEASLHSSLEGTLGLELGSRQRSLSTPPITIKGGLATSPTPIPTNLSTSKGRHWKLESPESNGSSVGSTSSQDQEEEEGLDPYRKVSGYKKEFIPPHILAQQREQSGSFEVGTARAVTLWEQQRRKQHGNV